jgi:Arc/MetJ-type ribon-helix-helix transcriptional regulator
MTPVRFSGNVDQGGSYTMTITLSDEQSRLLEEMVKAGIAGSPEEAVDRAVRALHSSATTKQPIHLQVDNLADLFARSPFRGLDMEFERDQDLGRDISL